MAQRPFEVTYRASYRRQWPYWVWTVWEKMTGQPSEIIWDGLTLRRKTAERRANEFVEGLEAEHHDRLEKRDVIRRNWNGPDHPPVA